MAYADDHDPRIGTLIKEKWRVDERLGEGGMATVYAATHRNGSRVALKILDRHHSRNTEARQRFLREGYVANAVGHAGAVKVLDDDVTEDGMAFLVMELLEGESLEARRKRLGGRLPLEDVLAAGDQLLDLLAAAHDKRIFHRDIKPDNIFITHQGQLKLLDFGVAQMRLADGAQVTGTGLMLGTPDFMSPEQAGGSPDEIDGRSDLWSVGAMMFTLLSGQTVHVTPTLRDHIIATATKPPRPLLSAAPWVPKRIAAVIDRALKLEKPDRWADAAQMQRALRLAARSLGEDDAEEPQDDVTQYTPMKFSEPPPDGPPEPTLAMASPPDSGAHVHPLARTQPDDSRAPDYVDATGKTERMAPVVRPPAPPPAAGAPPPARHSPLTGPAPLAPSASYPGAPRAPAPMPADMLAAPMASQPRAQATLTAHAADPRQITAARRVPGRAALAAAIALLVVAALVGVRVIVAQPAPGPAASPAADAAPLAPPPASDEPPALAPVPPPTTTTPFDAPPDAAVDR